ncbi:MAG: hypothetical protein QM680_01500 [Luteolibacter sp.]
MPQILAGKADGIFWIFFQKDMEIFADENGFVRLVGERVFDAISVFGIADGFVNFLKRNAVIRTKGTDGEGFYEIDEGDAFPFTINNTGVAQRLAFPSRRRTNGSGYFAASGHTGPPRQAYKRRVPR